MAGITVGYTDDAQVQRLLGSGVFRPDEGDAGGRYYIDVRRRATLHVVMYTNAVVGELTLREGIAPAISSQERRRATTPLFTADEGFGNRHALRLGVSKEEVRQNLGPPEREVSSDEWRYVTTCSCEIQDFFTVSFKKGRLFQIVFSSPSG